MDGVRSGASFCVRDCLPFQLCVVAVRSLRPIEPISALARSGKVQKHPLLEWDYDEERNAQFKINPRTRTVPSVAELSHCLLRNGA